MRITFEMFGEKQFEREILRVGEHAGDARPVFNKIADDWMEWNREQFATEGARGSGGWAQLAPSTVKSRGSAHPILFDPRHSGTHLRDEATDRSNVEITDSWMHFLLPDREDMIGRFHQSGTENMPQRRVVEFTEFDKREMIRDLQLWIVKGELR